MYPQTYFSVIPPEHDSQTCFVLMPFALEYDNVYAAIVAAVTGPELTVASCKRADQLFGGGHVMSDVLENIARAEVVIADVTGRNANVFYELGIAHTVKPIQRVIILTQSLADLPFDLNHLRCISYEASPNGLESLKRQLIETIRDVVPASRRFSIADGGSHTFHERLPGPDRYLYDFDVNSVMTGENFAEFELRVRSHAIGEPVQIVSTENHGCKSGEDVEIPFLRWRLIVDRVADGRAYFCVSEHGASSPP
jgi:hypothetical protein